MDGLEKVGTIAFSELEPGTLGILRIRDTAKVCLAVRSLEESLNGHNLALALTEPDPSKQAAEVPTLYPYPEWNKASCLNLSAITQVYSDLQGIPLRNPWQFDTPHGALLVVENRIFLSGCAETRHGVCVDIFVDIRNGVIERELPATPCYLLTKWAIVLQGPNGQFENWIRFDATTTMKRKPM